MADDSTTTLVDFVRDAAGVILVLILPGGGDASVDGGDDGHGRGRLRVQPD